MHTPYPARAAAACRHGGVREHDRPTATRTTRGRLGPRLQAQPRRAHQARQGAARHPRRAPGADRRGLRGGARGGHRAAPVVGPLPRQAEDRHVHAARQAAGRLRRAGQAARDRRGLESLRPGVGELATRQNVQLHHLGIGQPARGLRAPRRRGHHDRRRLRRHRAQHHGLAGAGHRPARAVRLHRRHPGGGRFLLRQPRLLQPAAQAQVLDRRHAGPRQRARDQLHRAGGRAARGRGGLRRAGRRRALLGAAHRPGARRVRAQGRGRRGARRDHRRLGGRPQLPRQPRQGAPQVHDRRHRPRGHARAGRGAARPHARRLRACRRRRSPRAITSACTRRSSRGSATSACRCISA